jgi:uncharacterized RDD family membrane protein YckC
VSSPPPPGRPAQPGAGPSTYAGERLGLPPEGRGSVAGWGRRIVALFVDWIASLLVASFFAGEAVMQSHGWESWLPLLVFWLEASLLTALVGSSFGQLATRVAVVNIHGGPVTLLVALVRTALICVVVPPVIYNRDRRGLHDLVARTVTVVR